MKRIITIASVVCALSAGFLALAQTKSIKIDVAAEKAGAEPTHFVPIVGNWIVTKDGAKNVLMVDGRQWKRGDPSGGLADKARAIYGSKHEDFIDNVKAFAYFPYAIAQGVDDFRNGEISMRFQMVDGALDSCAGILFNVKPNGDYLAVRFNGKEDNWSCGLSIKARVSSSRGVPRTMPLQRKEWYAMKIAVQGTKLEGYLNGKKLLDYTLPEPVTGKVGVWSKTDSVSLFDDYTVMAQ